eukprot:jgi/Mesvir1/24367/Mv11039-RA.2
MERLLDWGWPPKDGSGSNPAESPISLIPNLVANHFRLGQYEVGRALIRVLHESDPEAANRLLVSAIQDISQASGTPERPGVTPDFAQLAWLAVTELRSLDPRLGRGSVTPSTLLRTELNLLLSLLPRCQDFGGSGIASCDVAKVTQFIQRCCVGLTGLNSQGEVDNVVSSEHVEGASEFANFARENPIFADALRRVANDLACALQSTESQAVPSSTSRLATAIFQTHGETIRQCTAQGQLPDACKLLRFLPPPSEDIAAYRDLLAGLVNLAFSGRFQADASSQDALEAASLSQATSAPSSPGPASNGPPGKPERQATGAAAVDSIGAAPSAQPVDSGRTGTAKGPGTDSSAYVAHLSRDGRAHSGEGPGAVAEERTPCGQGMGGARQGGGDGQEDGNDALMLVRNRAHGWRLLYEGVVATGSIRLLQLLQELDDAAVRDSSAHTHALLEAQEATGARDVQDGLRVAVTRHIPPSKFNESLLGGLGGTTDSRPLPEALRDMGRSPVREQLQGISTEANESTSTRTDRTDRTNRADRNEAGDGLPADDGAAATADDAMCTLRRNAHIPSRWLHDAWLKRRTCRSSGARSVSGASGPAGIDTNAGTLGAVIRGDATACSALPPAPPTATLDVQTGADGHGHSRPGNDSINDGDRSPQSLAGMGDLVQHARVHGCHLAENVVLSALLMLADARQAGPGPGHWTGIGTGPVPGDKFMLADEGERHELSQLLEGNVLDRVQLLLEHFPCLRPLVAVLLWDLLPFNQDVCGGKALMAAILKGRPPAVPFPRPPASDDRQGEVADTDASSLAGALPAQPQDLARPFLQTPPPAQDGAAAASESTTGVPGTRPDAAGERNRESPKGDTGLVASGVSVGAGVGAQELPQGGVIMDLCQEISYRLRFADTALHGSLAMDGADAACMSRVQAQGAGNVADARDAEGGAAGAVDVASMMDSLSSHSGLWVLHHLAPHIQDHDALSLLQLPPRWAPPGCISHKDHDVELYHMQLILSSASQAFTILGSGALDCQENLAGVAAGGMDAQVVPGTRRTSVQLDASQESDQGPDQEPEERARPQADARVCVGGQGQMQAEERQAPLPRWTPQREACQESTAEVVAGRVGKGMEADEGPGEKPLSDGHASEQAERGEIGGQEASASANAVAERERGPGGASGGLSHPAGESVGQEGTQGPRALGVGTSIGRVAEACRRVEQLLGRMEASLVAVTSPARKIWLVGVLVSLIHLDVTWPEHHDPSHPQGRPPHQDSPLDKRNRGAEMEADASAATPTTMVADDSKEAHATQPPCPLLLHAGGPVVAALQRVLEIVVANFRFQPPRGSSPGEGAPALLSDGVGARRGSVEEAAAAGGSTSTTGGLGPRGSLFAAKGASEMAMGSAGADHAASDAWGGGVWQRAIERRTKELSLLVDDLNWKLGLLSRIPPEPWRRWRWRDAMGVLRASPAHLLNLCLQRSQYLLGEEAVQRFQLSMEDAAALQLAEWVDASVSQAMVQGAKSTGAAPAGLDFSALKLSLSPQQMLELCLEVSLTKAASPALCEALLAQARSLIPSGEAEAKTTGPSNLESFREQVAKSLLSSLRESAGQLAPGTPYRELLHGHRLAPVTAAPSTTGGLLPANPELPTSRPTVELVGAAPATPPGVSRLLPSVTPAQSSMKQLASGPMTPEMDARAGRPPASTAGMPAMTLDARLVSREAALAESHLAELGRKLASDTAMPALEGLVPSITSGRDGGRGDAGGGDAPLSYRALGGHGKTRQALDLLHEAVKLADQGTGQFLSGFLHNILRVLSEEDIPGRVHYFKEDRVPLDNRGGPLALHRALEAALAGGRQVAKAGVAEKGRDMGGLESPAATGDVAGSATSGGMGPGRARIAASHEALAPALTSSTVAAALEGRDHLSRPASAVEISERIPSAPRSVSVVKTPSYLRAFVKYIADVGDLLASVERIDPSEYFKLLETHPQDLLMQLVFKDGEPDVASRVASCMSLDLVKMILSACMPPVHPPRAPAIALPAATPLALPSATPSASKSLYPVQLDVLAHVARSSPLRAVLACAFALLHKSAVASKMAEGTLASGVGAMPSDGGSGGTGEGAGVSVAQPGGKTVAGSSKAQKGGRKGAEAAKPRVAKGAGAASEKELLEFALSQSDGLPVLNRWIRLQENIRSIVTSGSIPATTTDDARAAAKQPTVAKTGEMRGDAGSASAGPSPGETPTLPPIRTGRSAHPDGRGRPQEGAPGVPVAPASHPVAGATGHSTAHTKAASRQMGPAGKEAVSVGDPPHTLPPMQPAPSGASAPANRGSASDLTTKPSQGLKSKYSQEAGHSAASASGPLPAPSVGGTGVARPQREEAVAGLAGVSSETAGGMAKDGTSGKASGAGATAAVKPALAPPPVGPLRPLHGHADMAVLDADASGSVASAVGAGQRPPQGLTPAIAAAPRGVGTKPHVPSSAGTDGSVSSAGSSSHKQAVTGGGAAAGAENGHGGRWDAGGGVPALMEGDNVCGYLWEDDGCYRGAVASLVASGRVYGAIAMADTWLPCGCPEPVLEEALAAEDSSAPGGRRGSVGGAEKPWRGGRSALDSWQICLRLKDKHRAASFALRHYQEWDLDAACDLFWALESDLAGGSHQQLRREVQAVMRRLCFCRAVHQADPTRRSWQETSAMWRSNPDRFVDGLVQQKQFSLAASIAAESGLGPMALRRILCQQVASLLASTPLQGGGAAKACQLVTSLDDSMAVPVALGTLPLVDSRSSKALLINLLLTRKAHLLSRRQRCDLEQRQLGLQVLASVPSPWSERSQRFYMAPLLVVESLCMWQQLEILQQLCARFPVLRHDSLFELYASKALCFDSLRATATQDADASATPGAAATPTGSSAASSCGGSHGLVSHVGGSAGNVLKMPPGMVEGASGGSSHSDPNRGVINFAPSQGDNLESMGRSRVGGEADTRAAGRERGGQGVGVVAGPGADGSSSTHGTSRFGAMGGDPGTGRDDGGGGAGADSATVSRCHSARASEATGRDMSRTLAAGSTGRAGRGCYHDDEGGEEGEEHGDTGMKENGGGDVFYGDSEYNREMRAAFRYPCSPSVTLAMALLNLCSRPAVAARAATRMVLATAPRCLGGDTLLQQASATHAEDMDVALVVTRTLRQMLEYAISKFEQAASEGLHGHDRQQEREGTACRGHGFAEESASTSNIHTRGDDKRGDAQGGAARGPARDHDALEAHPSSASVHPEIGQESRHESGQESRHDQHEAQGKAPHKAVQEGDHLPMTPLMTVASSAVGEERSAAVGAEAAQSMLWRLQLMERLLAEDVPVSLDELAQRETAGRLRDRLARSEHYGAALDVCRCFGVSAAPVYEEWGLNYLQVGCYDRAWDMLRRAFACFGGDEEPRLALTARIVDCLEMHPPLRLESAVCSQQRLLRSLAFDGEGGGAFSRDAFLNILRVPEWDDGTSAAATAVTIPAPMVGAGAATPRGAPAGTPPLVKAGPTGAALAKPGLGGAGQGTAGVVTVTDDRTRDVLGLGAAEADLLTSLGAAPLPPMAMVEEDPVLSSDTAAAAGGGAGAQRGGGADSARVPAAPRLPTWDGRPGNYYDDDSSDEESGDSWVGLRGRGAGVQAGGTGGGAGTSGPLGSRMGREVAGGAAVAAPGQSCLSEERYRECVFYLVLHAPRMLFHFMIEHGRVADACRAFFHGDLLLRWAVAKACTPAAAAAETENAAAGVDADNVIQRTATGGDAGGSFPRTDSAVDHRTGVPWGELEAAGEMMMPTSTMATSSMAAGIGETQRAVPISSADVKGKAVASSSDVGGKTQERRGGGNRDPSASTPSAVPAGVMPGSSMVASGPPIASALPSSSAPLPCSRFGDVEELCQLCVAYAAVPTLLHVVRCEGQGGEVAGTGQPSEVPSLPGGGGGAVVSGVAPTLPPPDTPSSDAGSASMASSTPTTAMSARTNRGAAGGGQEKDKDKDVPLGLLERVAVYFKRHAHYRHLYRVQVMLGAPWELDAALTCVQLFMHCDDARGIPEARAHMARAKKHLERALATSLQHRPQRPHGHRGGATPSLKRLPSAGVRAGASSFTERSSAIGGVEVEVVGHRSYLRQEKMLNYMRTVNLQMDILTALPVGSVPSDFSLFGDKDSDPRVQRRLDTIAHKLVDLNFDLAFRVVEDLSLDAASIYGDVAEAYARGGQHKAMATLLRNVKGTVGDDVIDQVLERAFNGYLATNSAKAAERLVPSLNSTERKVRLWLKLGNLNKAFELATESGDASDVEAVAAEVS